MVEKVERRMYRVVSSLDDLSSTFAKCACGCFGDSSVNDTTVAIKKETVVAPRNKRRNTASTHSSSENNNDNLEVDPALSMADSITAFMDSSTNESPSNNKFRMGPEEPGTTLAREGLPVHTPLPSGLSVEPEDDAEDDLVDELTNGENYYATLKRPSRMSSPVPCGDI